MARKEKIVTIPAESGNRDAGKSFFIREAPAVQTEKWAARALLAISRGGADIPPEVIQMGAGAIVAAGMRALLTMEFPDLDPLLDEMKDRISFLPDRARPDVIRPLDDDDVEEVKTLLLLRSEVIELHVGFSIAAFLSKLGLNAAKAA